MAVSYHDRPIPGRPKTRSTLAPDLCTKKAGVHHEPGICAELLVVAPATILLISCAIWPYDFPVLWRGEWRPVLHDAPYPSGVLNFL
jgi:hypothetical protein